VRNRLRFLMRASDLLNESLDYQSTLSALARLSVPELADYCLVDLVEPDGRIRLVVVAHPDPAKAELLWEMSRRWPVDGSSGGIAQVIASGEPVLASEVTDEMLAAYASDPERLRALRAMEIRSTIIAPMVLRGRVVGAITLNRTDPVRRYGPADLLVTQELAARAAAAIEQARLYRAEQEARADAQRSAARTARLQALTAALSEASTAQAVADLTVQHGMRAVEANGGCLSLLTADGRGQALISVEAQGMDEALLASMSPFSLDDPHPMNDAVRDCAMVTAASLAELTERYPALAEPCARTGYEAFLAAPLELGGRAVGSVAYHFRERRGFSPDDLAFVQALARQATIALERARLFDAEHEARERAEDANRAKSQFLATMSHELRTPLNAVLGYADLLAAGVHGSLTPRQEIDVERIRTGANHLVTIIDQILTFARVEARREELHLAPVDLVELARDAVGLLEREASAHGLRVAAGLPETSLVMETDAGKLTQILINLLGNAVKFTERGEIELRLDDRGRHVCFDIRDTGPGIPREHLEKIFEPFVRLDGTGTGRQGGTGLGLAVSLRFARLLGGDLSVASTLGEGTTFTLRLPRSGEPSLGA
jgi:signal transduction histidine kinase